MPNLAEDLLIVLSYCCLLNQISVHALCKVTHKTNIKVGFPKLSSPLFFVLRNIFYKWSFHKLAKLQVCAQPTNTRLFTKYNKSSGPQLDVQLSKLSSLLSPIIVFNCHALNSFRASTFQMDTSTTNPLCF